MKCEGSVGSPKFTKKKKKKIQSWQLHRLSLDPQTGLVEFNQNVEQKIMF